MVSKLIHPLNFRSHKDRLRSPSTIFYHVTLEQKRYVDSYKEGPNGVLVKDCKVVSFDPCEELSSYKVSDFSLENLQSIGAKLDTSFLYSHDKMDIVDDLTSHLDYLNSIEVANNNSNNNNNK